MKGLLYKDEYMWMVWNQTCGEDLPVFMECNVSFSDLNDTLSFNDIKFKIGQEVEYEREIFNKHSYARIFLTTYI